MLHKALQKVFFSCAQRFWKTNQGLQEMLQLIQSAKSQNPTQTYLEMDAALYDLSTQEAGKDPKGHPKHRFLRYFDWFASHLKDDDRVLDVGSGFGQMSAALAQGTQSHVIGLEIESEKVKVCQSRYTQSNLEFVCGDVTQMDIGKFQNISVVTLSNVLEHIEKRQELLAAIRKIAPRLLLIRVPQYDRDWRVPLKEELGVDYRLDPTHVLEYTEETLDKELVQAQFLIISKKFNWGEIWVACQQK